MRAIFILFDTLSKRFLENYGNTWIKTPNFLRLEEKCLKYDNFYIGSTPCMPARRELHTGMYNFMHRSWGPLEPFDFSVVEELKNNGIYTHLCTDHSHYFEDGGATYHTRYNSWEGFRGQEGDRWTPYYYANVPESRGSLSKTGLSVKYHYANRLRQIREEDMSSVKTMKSGIDFIKKNVNRDNWFLQIECFDPHEPFYLPKEYRDLYELGEVENNWPRYGNVDTKNKKVEIKKIKKEYAALITLCDKYLGYVLDVLDENNMWENTMLIVGTDHGFLLGEHDMLGKNFGPLYQEIANIPFFIHHPEYEQRGDRKALSQTVDIAPTLMDYFNIEKKINTDGYSLICSIKNDCEVRKFANFGLFGSYSCITDGKKVFMKSNKNPNNQPLVECTLMPTKMRGFFKEEYLKNPKLVNGNRYSNGIPFLKYETQMDFYDNSKRGDLLFNLEKDPNQNSNIVSEENKEEWKEILTKSLVKLDTPKEELDRLGLL